LKAPLLEFTSSTTVLILVRTLSISTLDSSKLLIISLIFFPEIVSFTSVPKTPSFVVFREAIKPLISCMEVEAPLLTF